MIKSLWPQYKVIPENITCLLPSVLLFVLRTRKNTDSNKLMIFSGIAFTIVILKVPQSPVFSRLTNLESKLIEFFVFVNFERTVSFGSLQLFTVRKIGDFPHFLLALASNNAFIIKLVKMWTGGTWSEL